MLADTIRANFIYCRVQYESDRIRSKSQIIERDWNILVAKMQMLKYIDKIFAGISRKKTYVTLPLQLLEMLRFGPKAIIEDCSAFEINGAPSALDGTTGPG